jgi:hypothetical protein
MKMFKNSCWLHLLVAVLLGFAFVPKGSSQEAASGINMRGTVSGPDGKPMEGVTVSIRGQG